MEREELIKKWLDHNLNSEEQKAFEELDDYADLLKLSKSLEDFKSPDYSIDYEYDNVKSRLKPKASNNWVRPLLKIAAVLLISFSIFYYNSTLDTEVKTLVAEDITISLPDASTVNLNAQSTIVYNKNSWTDKREVSLDGEAFFSVAEGSKFDVITSDGKISVLGTQFNVIQRLNYFEVTCFEGLVAVNYKSKSLKLNPGNRFVVIDGIIKNEKENRTQPSWLSNETSFASAPLKYVLDELERQYDISVDASKLDGQQLFSGSFTHDNLDLALKSITLPLGITYTKSNSVIVLNGE
ncbi:FecR family protein [Winogradskyella haliclonae]|uniref:Anti-sigma factor n=1 Tax=Winogradskyella haliclonae TaxID=2048558 RepID=A0ABQ2C3C6_9FLAO|nr:FecR domain-containing protein [Winogradskyella haliclonae]GGI58233.1 anti-sigma factor [Winogradskyella haliclonae]